MLTVQEMAALPDDDPRKIVYRIRSQQTRAAASRRLVFDYDDAAAIEMLARVIANARHAERERCACLIETSYGVSDGFITSGRKIHNTHLAAAIRALHDAP